MLFNDLKGTLSKSAAGVTDMTKIKYQYLIFLWYAWYRKHLLSQFVVIIYFIIIIIYLIVIISS